MQIQVIADFSKVQERHGLEVQVDLPVDDRVADLAAAVGANLQR